MSDEKSIEMRETQRGFLVGEFLDSYGESCSIQESSSMIPHIWLGRQQNNPPHHVTGEPLSPRMHLSQSQVQELLPLLQRFAETGELR